MTGKYALVLSNYGTGRLIWMREVSRHGLSVVLFLCTMVRADLRRDMKT